MREKIEKEMLQQYKEKLTEEIQEQVIKDYRKLLTEEIRAELTPIIKEECKQERKLKKARKRAKTLELIQNEILSISQETKAKASNDNANEKKPTQNIENDTDEDEFDVAPEPDIDNIE